MHVDDRLSDSSEHHVGVFPQYRSGLQAAASCTKFATSSRSLTPARPRPPPSDRPSLAMAERVCDTRLRRCKREVGPSSSDGLSDPMRECVCSQIGIAFRLPVSLARGRRHGVVRREHGILHTKLLVEDLLLDEASRVCDGVAQCCGRGGRGLNKACRTSRVCAGWPCEKLSDERLRGFLAIMRLEVPLHAYDGIS